MRPEDRDVVRRMREMFGDYTTDMQAILAQVNEGKLTTSQQANLAFEPMKVHMRGLEDAAGTFGNTALMRMEATSAQMLSQGTAQQTSSVEETSSSLEEMSAFIAENFARRRRAAHRHGRRRRGRSGGDPPRRRRHDCAGRGNVSSLRQAIARGGAERVRPLARSPPRCEI